MQEEEGISFEQIVKEPEILLGCRQDAAELFLEMTAAFFQETKSTEIHEDAAGKLKSLLTEGFGQYSIWQQIKLQNDAVIKSAQDEFAKRQIKEKTAEEEEGYESDDEDIKRLLAEGKAEVEKKGEGEEEEEEEADDEADTKEKQKQEGEEEEDFEYDKENGIQNAHMSDVNFDEEEEEEEGGGLAPEVPNEDDEVAIALAGGKVEDKEDAKHMTYADFFGDEELDEKNAEISKIEDEMMAPKPWQLKGETIASERPKDALLDLDVQFAVTKTLPPDPLSSKELEALLVKRIEAMNFDDVVRKKRPTNITKQFEEISGVKSKKSLVELYEDDIRKTNDEFQDDTPKFTNEQREAIELWKSLEHELNKFTERRFMAQKPRDKVEITQGASVDAEIHPEPTKTPQEIMKPTRTTREMKGEIEQTHEEKRSERRAHKEWYANKEERKAAEKGQLYSQTGRDGTDVKTMQDVQKLMQGKLQGIETYQPGQTIPENKDEKKAVKKNYLL